MKTNTTQFDNFLPKRFCFVTESGPGAEQQAEAVQQKIETPEAVEARRNEVIAKVDGVLMKLEGDKDSAADEIQLRILQDPPTTRFLEQRDKGRLDQFRDATRKALQDALKPNGVAA